MSTKTQFSFLTLAGELRDLIYEHLLTSCSPTKLSSGLTASASAVCIPKLLTINKQFSKEYLSVSRKHSFLSIDDDPIGSYVSPGKKLPYLTQEFRNVAKVEFNITCLGFAAGDEIIFHEQWVNQVLGQLNPDLLEKIEINLHLNQSIDVRETSPEYETALLWSGNWTNNSKVEALRVYKSDVRHLEWAFSDQVRILLMHWDRERKMFVREKKAQRDEEERKIWLNTT